MKELKSSDCFHVGDVVQICNLDRLRKDLRGKKAVVMQVHIANNAYTVMNEDWERGLLFGHEIDLIDSMIK